MPLSSLLQKYAVRGRCKGNARVCKSSLVSASVSATSSLNGVGRSLCNTLQTHIECLQTNMLLNSCLVEEAPFGKDSTRANHVVDQAQLSLRSSCTSTTLGHLHPSRSDSTETRISCCQRRRTICPNTPAKDLRGSWVLLF